MKIGYIQFAPELGQLGETLKILDGLEDDYRDADLMVLPELANSGYNFESREQAFATAEEIHSSRFLEYLREKSIHHQTAFVAGFNELDNNRLFNTCVLVAEGQILGKYRKIHLFLNEKDFFQPGDLGFPVYDWNELKIGMLICFDWIFPEAWRTLALKGADIICHPSNLVIPGLAQKAVPVRAVENHIFVITANRIGTEGNLTFTGLSTIAGPGGDILFQAGEKDQSAHWIEVNPMDARDKWITKRNHVINDRMPDTYFENGEY